MGVSKPQEYCQELQLAVGRAKLPGYFGACALSNRNEQLNLQKRTYFVGTEAPLSQESGQRYQNSYTPRLGPILDGPSTSRPCGLREPECPRQIQAFNGYEPSPQ
jgi:hypothetical protein